MSYTPFVCNITNITRGVTTKVFFDVNHGFVLGNLVRFFIPNEWGIIQLNGLKGYVTNVSNTTIKVNIDSRSFAQFSTPVVTPPEVIQTPQAIPAGDGNTGYQVIVLRKTYTPVGVDTATIPGAYEAPPHP